MIRTGSPIARISAEQYVAYYAGAYRMLRNCLMTDARVERDEERRANWVNRAKANHRELMRILREARRDQLARGGV